jgi:hypothetical protein
VAGWSTNIVEMPITCAFPPMEFMFSSDRRDLFDEGEHIIIVSEFIDPLDGAQVFFV